jgi:hypothetical protein
MMGAMAVFGIAISGTLICCLLVAHPRNRRAGRGSSRDGFSGADSGGTGDSGSHFGWFDGHHSSSDHSGNPGDGGGDSGGSSDGGGSGGDGGGGGGGSD